MPRITYTVEGGQRTVRNLSMFNEQKVKAVQTLVRKTTNAVRKDAKKRVPVSPSNRKKTYGSPGDLKKSIRAKYYYNNLGAMVIPMKPKGSHRYIVEHGTVNRRNKSGAYRGRVTPTPFMEPAKQAQDSSYNAALRQIFEGDDTVI